MKIKYSPIIHSDSPVHCPNNKTCSELQAHSEWLQEFKLPDEPVIVGGAVCSECQSFLSKDTKQRVVHCVYPRKIKNITTTTTTNKEAEDAELV